MAIEVFSVTWNYSKITWMVSKENDLENYICWK